jgi:hypothetical protein
MLGYDDQALLATDSTISRDKKEGEGKEKNTHFNNVAI